MSEDVSRLIRDLRKIPGVTVQRAGSGHWSVRKDGRLVTSIASTPSDRRAWANMQAELQRAGIDPNVRRKVRRRRVTAEQIAAAKQADPPAASAAGHAEADAPADETVGSEREELSVGPAEVLLPYEEETEISLSAERTPSGWLYTRVRMLVRTERWREPFELPHGDPRRKASSASGTTGGSKVAAPTRARGSAPSAPAPPLAPRSAASARPSPGRPTEGAPEGVSQADQESAIAAAPSAPAEPPAPEATTAPASAPPPKRQETSKGQGTTSVPQEARASGGEQRRRVAPSPRPIPGRIRTSAQPVDAARPPAWIQGSELPPRNAAEWRKAIPYGTDTPVWPTTRVPDEIDAHILLFINEEAPVRLRQVALQVGRQLGHSPEAIYPRVYRLAREGRVALMDDPATQRKAVAMIDSGTTET